MQRLHDLNAGVRLSASEYGSYYFVCTIGIWIEARVSNGRLPEKKIGARWSIDRWKSCRETPGILKQRRPQEEVWRIEIGDVGATGWRNGSIGGPNGEQPSANVWTLWGRDREHVECLPLGTAAPEFEFALFLEQDDGRQWENNQGSNFRISLAYLGKPQPERGA